MILLVAVAGDTHEDEDVITTLTWFAFASVVEVKVGLFVPTGVAFTYH